MSRIIGALALCLLAFAAALPSAGAQAAPVAAPLPFIGSVPADGGIALVAVTEEIAPPALVAALRDAGCEPQLLAVTIDGRFRVYSPGGLAFVNAAFPDPMLPPRAAIVSCARVSQVVDEHLVRLVTKDEPIASSFVPDHLVELPPELVLPGSGPELLTSETAEALSAMLEAASEAGHEVVVRSAYRSYAEQVYTYQYWVDLLGEEEAARRSAVPGHSEHQLGTVVDLTNADVAWDLVPEFGDTPAGRWLRRHAEEFGFVESYPEGAEAITGYLYEPWHLRYVGTTHADLVRLSGLTLTEYLERLQAELG